MPIDSNNPKKYTVDGETIPERVRAIEVGFEAHLEASNQAIAHFVKSVDKLENNFEKYQAQQCEIITRETNKCVQASEGVHQRMNELVDSFIHKPTINTAHWFTILMNSPNLKWMIIFLIFLLGGGTISSLTFLKDWYKQ